MLDAALTTLVQALDDHLRGVFSQEASTVVAAGLGAAGARDKLVLTPVAITAGETASYGGFRPRAGGEAAPVTLDLTCLLAAPFEDQVSGLKLLSAAMAHLVAHPVLDGRRAPGLPAEISRISVAMLKLDLGTQWSAWQALGVAMVPGVFYRVQVEVGAGWIEGD
ncbi:MAG: Pvc16 family protein [Pseudomonadota bacterium]